MSITFLVGVECSGGELGAGEPLRFRLGERTVEVCAILDRWPGGDHRYFKVLGDDGDLYILRHDREGDRWELTLYQRGDVAEPFLDGVDVRGIGRSRKPPV